MSNLTKIISGLIDTDSYVIDKITSIISSKQDLITQTNKLDYNLISGNIPTILSSGTNISITDNKIELNNNININTLSTTNILLNGDALNTNNGLVQTNWITGYIDNQLSSINQELLTILG